MKLVYQNEGYKEEQPTHTKITLQMKIHPTFQILCMRKCQFVKLILSLANSKFELQRQKPIVEARVCSGFLCKGDGSCTDDYSSSYNLEPIHYYNLVLAATEVILYVTDCEEFEDIIIPEIIKHPEWSSCFERRHVSISDITLQV